MPKHALKKDLTFSQNLASAPLSYTSSGGRRYKVESVSIKFSVAVTETVTITLDSVNGSDYDVVLETTDIIGETSYVWRPQGEANFQDGDEIKVQVTNANATGTAYGIIKRSELLQGA